MGDYSAPYAVRRAYETPVRGGTSHQQLSPRRREARRGLASKKAEGLRQILRHVAHREKLGAVSGCQVWRTARFAVIHKYFY